jgi:hypothetical protein
MPAALLLTAMLLWTSGASGTQAPAAPETRGRAAGPAQVRALLLAAEPRERPADWRPLAHARTAAALAQVARGPATPDPLRARALDALALLGPVARPTLWHLAREGRLPPELRGRLALALGGGDPEDLPALRALLHDPHPGVRRAAARALGPSSSAEARLALEEALAEEPDGPTREALQGQLSRLNP